jgi:phage baseplate assembly protein W
MASIKADYVNRIKESRIIYSDFPNNFDISPHSGDLSLVVNEYAVIQSLENLILTFLGERLYDDTIGSAIQFRAFELANEIESELIKNAIIDCATQNEPRVKIINVSVNFINDYSYTVDIYFNIINITEIKSLNLIIKRVR